MTLGKPRLLDFLSRPRTVSADVAEEQLGIVAISMGCALLRELLRRGQAAHLAMVRLTATMPHPPDHARHISGSVSIETEACEAIVRECLDELIAHQGPAATVCRDLQFVDVNVSVHSSIHIRV